MDNPQQTAHSPVEINLKDYLRIISARRWWLISIVVVSVSLTAVYNFKLPNIFQATATIQINKEAPNVVEVKPVMEMQSQANEFLKTQHKILSSHSIAERVIKYLELEKIPEFTGADEPKSFFQGVMERISPTDQSKNAEPQRVDMVTLYYKKVTITPVPLTLLVNIACTLKDRKLVAQIANAHAEAYMAYTLEQRLDATTGASDWLQNQSTELQAKLAKSEAALQAYREKNGTVSLDDKQNIVVEKLKQLNEQVTLAKNQRITAENSYNQLKLMKEKGGDPTTLAFVLQDPVVQEFKKKRSEKLAEVSKLKERYLDKHPALIAARSEVDVVERNLKLQVETLQSVIETDYQLAVSREKNMDQALKEQEQVVTSLNERQIGYEALKRQYEADRQMYETVLTRTRQTGVSKQLDTTNVTIVDRAVEPFKIYRPRRLLNVLIVFALSVMIGCALCVLLESLTETVRDPDDLTRDFQMPFLGYIPHRSRSLFHKQSAIANNGDAATSEAFRTALAVLSLQPESVNATCFIVTSATPSEGKTTCALNLAANFAEKNLRTLLIEADLRRPNLGKLLGLPAVGGLERLVDGNADGIIQATSQPNLSVVASARSPVNAHALVSLPAVREFITNVRPQFDRVVIDTPPIGAVSDALSLCALADGVIWVVRFDTVRKKVVADAFSRLHQVKAKVFGFIINNVDLSSRHNKYHYSYHGYDAYYGQKK